MTRMWQDVEGTIPATEPGQRIARVDSDGEAMIQRESCKRPTLDSEIDRLRAENEALKQSHEDIVRNALADAFNLGKVYWQYAEGESLRSHRKADETRKKFTELSLRTIAALAAKGGSA